MNRISLLAGWSWVFIGCPGHPLPEEVSTTVEPFPRCENHDALRQPWFGDTHVHTSLSLDANLQGNRLMPEDAYRFAMGEAVGIQPYDSEGVALRQLQLERPLDFVMLSDHAEFLGTVVLCTDSDSAAFETPECVSFRDEPDSAFVTINGLLAVDPEIAAYPELCGPDGQDCRAAGLGVWKDVQEAAEAFYDRTDGCRFTTFIGYEWSGNPAAENMHRNVMFRSEYVPEMPTGYFDEAEPEGLWARLRSECLDQPPCDVLAIPHNSNLSSGRMFRTPDDGRFPGLSESVATERAELEPLIEIFQHKGGSECWLGSPLSDEMCDFETLPYNNLGGVNLDITGEPVKRDFVRDILGAGLLYHESLGINPYRLGILASTDTHLGTPGAVGEADYPGHGGAGQANREALPVGLPDSPLMNPGGLAVAWAEENSREAIFRAFQRREVYGTSGPRIVLRFFGGWEFSDETCADPEWVGIGYERGVPMGAQLSTSTGDGAPSFIVNALADAGTDARPGALLQRLQMVKVSAVAGELAVQVYDIAGDADWGATVDVSSCAVAEQGSSTMCSVWTDPDFDRLTPALWYVRVLETATCRWQTRQCLDAGIVCPTDDEDWAGCCDERAAMTVQERAWSSPIWYLP